MDKSIEDMIKELYTVVLGVPSTGEKGMAKLVYDIEKHLTELNCSVKTNTTWRKALCWALGLLAGVWTGVIIYVFSVMPKALP